MNKSKESISDEQLLSELKEYFSYDPITGEFIPITNRYKNSKKERSVVRYNEGKPYIRFKKGKYYISHLAWLYTYGEMPKSNLMHLDNNHNNNAILNLKLGKIKLLFIDDSLLLEHAMKYLSYCPITGLFTRLRLNGGFANAKIGDNAGTIQKNGYVSISINGRHYKAHRLAWLFVYGHLPKEQIDHINRNRADNRICNLRESSILENAQNKNTKIGTCGLRGVRANGNKYTTSITVNNIRTYLGNFNTAIEAHKAYLLAKRKYHSFYTI